VQTSSRPFEENGQVAGIIGIMTEMTERKHADEARKRSEESFRAMIRKNIHYYRGS
jgi:signal transduction histidine kinase